VSTAHTQCPAVLACAARAALKATEKSLEAHKRLLQEAKAANRNSKGFQGLDIGVSQESLRTVLSQKESAVAVTVTNTGGVPRTGCGGRQGGQRGLRARAAAPAGRLPGARGPAPSPGGRHAGCRPRIRRVDIRPQDAVAAVVVMACNRPDYLKRTIKSILE